MTGTGAYYYIVWGIWLRHHLNYKQNEYELDWPNFWTVPEIKGKGSPAARDQAKGRKEL